MKTEKYRIDEQTGACYEYDKAQNAYLFIGNLNGRSPKEFIEDYEEWIEFLTGQPPPDMNF